MSRLSFSVAFIYILLSSFVVYDLSCSLGKFYPHMATEKVYRTVLYQTNNSLRPNAFRKFAAPQSYNCSIYLSIQYLYLSAMCSSILFNPCQLLIPITGTVTYDANRYFVFKKWQRYSSCEEKCVWGSHTHGGPIHTS